MSNADSVVVVVVIVPSDRLSFAVFVVVVVVVAAICAAELTNIVDISGSEVGLCCTYVNGCVFMAIVEGAAVEVNIVRLVDDCCLSLLSVNNGMALAVVVFIIIIMNSCA